MPSLRAARARTWFAAVLMAAVFLAPVAGFTHRIVHGALFLDAAVAAPQASLHACAAFDAAALAPALAATLPSVPVVPRHARAPDTPAHVSPLLPFMAQFLSRAPPRRLRPNLAHEHTDN